MHFSPLRTPRYYFSYFSCHRWFWANYCHFGIWQAVGRQLAGIWQAIGRHLAGIWQASSRQLAGIGAKLKKFWVRVWSGLGQGLVPAYLPHRFFTRQFRTGQALVPYEDPEGMILIFKKIMKLKKWRHRAMWRGEMVAPQSNGGKRGWLWRR